MSPRHRVVTAWCQALLQQSSSSSSSLISTGAQHQRGWSGPGGLAGSSCFRAALARTTTTTTTTASSSSSIGSAAAALRQHSSPSAWRPSLTRSFAASRGGPAVTPRTHLQPDAATAAAATGRASAAAGGPAAATAGRAAAAAGAAGRAAAGGAAGTASLSGFARWWRTFQTVPIMPKWLGLTGAIPFIALAPPVCKHLDGLLPALVLDNCGTIQVCYGALIVTFLGAVHWGVAMSSPLAAHAVGSRIINEAYLYSVLPSLAAWPATMMEPGAGSVVISILLVGCFAADYTRRNLGLPAWYMALRVPLTLLATYGMLLTATRHLHLEMDRFREVAASEAAPAPAAAAEGGTQ